MKNDISSEIVAEVQSLFALAIATKSEIADVFVSYSPHAQKCVSVRIYKHGWFSEADVDFDKSVYLDWDNHADDVKHLRQQVESFIATIPAERPNLDASKAATWREAAAKLLAQADAITNQPVSP